jgi:pantoate--beta-alanine ligase
VTYRLIRDPAELRAHVDDLRRDGKVIAVVPTMGYLHDGHLSLLRAARARADVVILTIFVNPTQFGPTEDLSRYPRDEAGDLAKAAAVGLDVAFCPDAAAMYPPAPRPRSRSATSSGRCAASADPATSPASPRSSPSCST